MGDVLAIAEQKDGKSRPGANEVVAEAAAEGLHDVREFFVVEDFFDRSLLGVEHLAPQR